jgi:3-isopropylmalate/(R)-2-methylmalate dehydratase small subunit
MIEATLASPGLEIAVDLEAQTVGIVGLTPGPGEEIPYRFEVDAYRKKCLLSGLDELGYTLTQLDKIESFERSYILSGMGNS